MPRLALSAVPPEEADADLLALPVAAGRGRPRGPGGDRGGAGPARGRPGPRSAGPGGSPGPWTRPLVVPGYGALAAPAVLLVGVGPTPTGPRRPCAGRRRAAVAAAGKAATLAVALHRVDLADAPGDHAAPRPPWPRATALAAYRFRRQAASRPRAWPGGGHPAGRRRPGPGRGRARCCAGPRSPPAATLARPRPGQRAGQPDQPGHPGRRGRSGLAKAAGLDAPGAGRAGPAPGPLRAPCWPSAAGRPPAPAWSSCGYRPPGARRHVALVGKGVTFDHRGARPQARRRHGGHGRTTAGAAPSLAAVTAAAELGACPPP